MPASAVSIGNVTCFSTSTGEKAGQTVLICTWLFVMSGTASIGSRRSDSAPDERGTEREENDKQPVVDGEVEDLL